MSPSPAADSPLTLHSHPPALAADPANGSVNTTGTTNPTMKAASTTTSAPPSPRLTAKTAPIHTADAPGQGGASMSTRATPSSSPTPSPSPSPPRRKSFLSRLMHAAGGSSNMSHSHDQHHHRHDQSHSPRHGHAPGASPPLPPSRSPSQRALGGGASGKHSPVSGSPVLQPQPQQHHIQFPNSPPLPSAVSTHPLGLGILHQPDPVHPEPMPAVLLTTATRSPASNSPVSNPVPVPAPAPVSHQHPHHFHHDKFDKHEKHDKHNTRTPSPGSSPTASPSPPTARRRSSFKELMANGAIRLARSLSPNHGSKGDSPATSPSSEDLPHHNAHGRPATPTFTSMLLGPLVAMAGGAGQGQGGGSGGSSSSSPQPAAQQHPFTEKYGKCERGCIGKGATAVVRVAHKVRSPSQSSLPGITGSGWPSGDGGLGSPSTLPRDHAPLIAESSDGSDPAAFVDQVVAIKEFRRRRKHETEREYLKKVTAEFCISSSLHHVNIVQTLDLIQDEHHHWCEVMEYCAGGDLFSTIQSGLMDDAEIQCVWKQLMYGVCYLHESGVAHRDLKPENLLLDSHGRLKVTDFGVSEVFKMGWESKPHLSEGICGSAPYIAPEVFDNQKYDARKLDIWACGIIFYACKYGGIPWRQASSDDPNYATYLTALNSYNRRVRSSNASTASKSTAAAQGGSGARGFEALDRLSSGCRDLMYRILEPDPMKRIDVHEIMQDPWFRSIRTCHEDYDEEEDEAADGGADHHGLVNGKLPKLKKSHVHHTVIGEVRADPLSKERRKRGGSSASTAGGAHGASSDGKKRGESSASVVSAVAEVGGHQPVSAAAAGAGLVGAVGPKHDSAHSLDAHAASLATGQSKSPANNGAGSQPASRSPSHELLVGASAEPKSRHAHSPSTGSTASSSNGGTGPGTRAASGPLSKIEVAVKDLLHQRHVHGSHGAAPASDHHHHHHHHHSHSHPSVPQA